MKRSLIITLLICLVLGESFSFITDHETIKKENEKKYCCKKVCNGSGKDKQKKNNQSESYLPMVNMLRL